MYKHRTCRLPIRLNTPPRQPSSKLNPIRLKTIFLDGVLRRSKNIDSENGNILAKGSASQIKEKYAPSKLTGKMKDAKQPLHSKTLKENKFELDALDSSQVLDFLTKNKNQIEDFEYHKGSINDAFIKITGKELQ